MRWTIGEKCLAWSILLHVATQLAARSEEIVELMTPEGAGAAVFASAILILASAFVVAGDNQPNRVGR